MGFWEVNLSRSDLPFGSEFSPSQISLEHLLELVAENECDWKAFEDSIRVEYFDTPRYANTAESNRRKLANNTRLSMIAYSLIDRYACFTDLGRSLYSIRKDQNALYRIFAKHILLNLRGLTLVQCVQDMDVAGIQINLLTLREQLEQRGVNVPRGGKHLSTIRIWLEMAGVFASGWRVNESRLEEILGAAQTELETLSQLSPEQRSYLKTLADMGGPGPYLSNEIEKLAAATYGTKFNEKALARTVLYPLEKAGYIVLSSGTRQPGRGAKPSQVRTTKKLETDIILPYLKQIEQQIGTAIRAFLRKPLGEVLQDIESTDSYISGLALEALAFKLMRLVGLDFVATRLRSSGTGWGEVDLIFQSNRLVFSRWQIQCKNTKTVSLDDVAKEVGLTHFLKSNVIVVVSTGQISSEARRYSNRVMQDSNLCIALLDRQDILSVVQNQPAIVDILNREARHAMKLKPLQLHETSG